MVPSVQRQARLHHSHEVVIDPMNSERIIRIMAGSFILLSLLLGAPASPLYHSGYWLGSPLSLGSTYSRAVLPASVQLNKSCGSWVLKKADTPAGCSN